MIKDRTHGHDGWWKVQWWEEGWRDNCYPEQDLILDFIEYAEKMEAFV